MAALVVGFWLTVGTLLFLDILISILQRWNMFPTSMYRITQRDGKFYAEYFLVYQNLTLGIHKGWGWHPVVFHGDAKLAQVYSKGSDVGFDNYRDAHYELIRVKEKIESQKTIITYYNK